MSKLTVSPVILQEIGRIAVLESHIEGCLALVVTNLSGVPQLTGDALTKAMSLKTLVEVVRSLAALRLPLGDPDGADLLQAVKDASTLAQERNAIVHSMWGFGSDFGPSSAIRVKVGGFPPSLESKPVTLAELQSLAEKMEAVLSILVYLHPKMRRAAP
jgi:hypothetical protein